MQTQPEAQISIVPFQISPCKLNERSPTTGINPGTLHQTYQKRKTLYVPLARVLLESHHSDKHHSTHSITKAGEKSIWLKLWSSEKQKDLMWFFLLSRLGLFPVLDPEDTDQCLLLMTSGAWRCHLSRRVFSGFDQGFKYKACKHHLIYRMAVCPARL